jgi:hypothetical protein
MENRDGLLVDLKISQATGTAEREAAEEMIKRQRRRGCFPKIRTLIMKDELEQRYVGSALGLSRV